MLRREFIVSAERPAGPVIVIATYLPLRRWRHLFPFLRLNGQVIRQLQGSPGLLRYGLATEPVKKHFWTVSVWTHREAALEFVRAEPHATAVRRFPEWAARGAAFVEWSSPDPRISWDDALHRLTRAPRQS